jgi:hypothetical protein
LKCSFFFCSFVGCTARTSILLHPADNGGELPRHSHDKAARKQRCVVWRKHAVWCFV